MLLSSVSFWGFLLMIVGAGLFFFMDKKDDHRLIIFSEQKLRWGSITYGVAGIYFATSIVLFLIGFYEIPSSTPRGVLLGVLILGIVPLCTLGCFSFNRALSWNTLRKKQFPRKQI